MLDVSNVLSGVRCLIVFDTREDGLWRCRVTLLCCPQVLDENDVLDGVRGALCFVELRCWKVLGSKLECCCKRCVCVCACVRVCVCVFYLIHLFIYLCVGGGVEPDVKVPSACPCQYTN